MTHVDDLVPKLNLVQQSDLTHILSLTPYRRRVAVMLAYVDLYEEDWCNMAGLSAKSVRDWLRGTHKMPFGAAYRLARVIGVDPEQLFTALLHVGLEEPNGIQWRR